MKKNIATIIASIFIAIIFASCSKQLVQENHTLEIRLQEKTRHANEFRAELNQKKLETERLKAEIGRRDKTIEALRTQLQFEKAGNDDLQKKVDELTIINLKQKLQLKTLQESLWAATRERDFWVQKFHTTIHNTAQIIEMKSGIIDRQKKAIEQQNEMMIQYIRKLDIARKNANSPVIQDLPQD